jgi:RelE toxin of RelE / RelB toxin-antitoxin system
MKPKRSLTASVCAPLAISTQTSSNRSWSRRRRCDFGDRSMPYAISAMEEKAFFIFGFAKNERANISSDEVRALSS